MNRVFNRQKLVRGYKKFYRTSFDIVKWSAIAALTGAIVGFAVGGALIFLEFSINYLDLHKLFGAPSFIFLPLALALSAALTGYKWKEAVGDGTEEVVKSAIFDKNGPKTAAFFSKQVATLITLIFGGSAGKEAPSAQIGAFVSALGARALRLKEQHKIVLIISGVSAGFAVVFGAPIAAGFFALEALFSGKILYRVLVPSFISSFVAYWSMHILKVEYIYHPIYVALVPDFWEILNLIKAVAAGIFFGAAAYGVIVAMNLANRLAKHELDPVLKGFIGGVLLIALTYLFGDKYLGLGLDTINRAFYITNEFEWYDPILKTLFTLITLGFGGSGGFVTPLFFIGAVCGNLFAQTAEADVALYAALGFVSVLSGATNSPIATTILAAELFGIEVAHFAAVTSTISYLISSQKSVFAPEIIESIEIRFKRAIKD